MEASTETVDARLGEPERPLVLELADGTRLVPPAGARPVRVEGDRDHAFTLADVQRAGGEPFAGYRREAA